MLPLYSQSSEGVFIEQDILQKIDQNSEHTLYIIFELFGFGICFVSTLHSGWRYNDEDLSSTDQYSVAP
jgi:hypothetical protein